MADDTDLDDDALERKVQLAGDAALYARLVEVGFTGPDFQVAADALARYAYPILRAWLVSGQIVHECARKGIGGIRSLAAGEVTLTRHDIDDLVQDTLLIALTRFQRAGQKDEGWSSQGGALLRTYFIGGCLLAFGVAYHRWEHQRPRHHSMLTDLGSPPSLLDDPVDLLALRDTLADALPPPGRARTAVLLHADGYTHAEIARILGDEEERLVTPRAVEALLYRHRVNLKERGRQL